MISTPFRRHTDEDTERWQEVGCEPGAVAARNSGGRKEQWQQGAAAARQGAVVKNKRRRNKETRGRRWH